ncbi:metallophosphoesterase [Mycobacterium sp. 852002-53434_SCH5985345]|uniref:metallophosphoesterase family protein n=1 Tax=Mycobacterium sp. 852002-53434_SCH5985345 TaxID=1834107 RepID=UPI0009ED6012|nr:metallophosphoesterase [Mycobacterium sp. 852002-53434_SCH5985345]
MSELTAVVVSDLHATSKPPGDSAGSWLTTNTPETPQEHPIIGLRSFLREKHPIKPDLLLVAGDICDKADEAALKYAWRHLVELANDTGATLIATAGNHDLDSRHQADIDPRGALYDLIPPFPALDNTTRDEFWSKNFAVVEPARDEGSNIIPWRVVTLNSAAFHGYVGNDDRELDHGRISKRTARRLRAELESRNQEANLNIMLVHHHLHQLPYIDQEEQSIIRDVYLLTELLEEFSPWIVIHGHKHRGRLLFAGGEGHAPAIFSAASMSAFPLTPSATAGTTNQAYIVTFADPERLEMLQDIGVGGRFIALDWAPTKGWKFATSSNEFTLPGRGGFGWRADPRTLATSIAREMTRTNVTSISREELLALEPRLDFLSPTGINMLADKLERRAPSLMLHRDEHGEITKVDRLVGPKEQAEQSLGR